MDKELAKKETWKLLSQLHCSVKKQQICEEIDKYVERVCESGSNDVGCTIARFVYEKILGCKENICEPSIKYEDLLRKFNESLLGCHDQ